MEQSTNAAANRSPLGTVPVLVYDHGLEPNNRQTTAFAIGDRSLHTSVVPELAGNHYHVTPHGWALLVAPGPSPRTRLWDPRSGQSVSLPAMEREPPEGWECCLSAAPTSPSCVVLVLHMKEPKFLYCRVGDSRWSVHEYDLGDVKLPPSYAPPRKIVIQEAVAVGGRFYFNTGKMGAINFSPATAPELSFIDYPHPVPEFPDGSNGRREYMVESRGELFSVYICVKGFTPEILTVCVYKIDPSGAAGPVEVDDLGDRVFLLSYSNAQLLCSASKYGVKRNCVYFLHNVMGDMDGGPLYIFDIDDKSLKTIRPCPEMAELLRSPFWMLPTDQDNTHDSNK